jgi:hypothetical protein
MAGRGSPAIWRKEKLVFAIGGNLMVLTAVIVPTYLSYFIYSIFSSRDEFFHK